jgi:hypothetical protein
MPLPEAVSNRLIGALFVERGLVSQSQLLVALELQQETGQQLGQILVERFGVERSDLAKVVAEHWARLGEAEENADSRASESWRQLGEILVDRGFVTREQLAQALDRQRQTGERLGEALVGQGVLTKFELAGSLAEQASTSTEETADVAGAPAPVVPLVRAPEKQDDPVEEAPEDLQPEPSETVPREEPTEETAEEPAPRWPALQSVPTVTATPMPAEPDEARLDEAEPEQHVLEPAADAAPEEPDAVSGDEATVAAYVAFASTPRGYRLVVLEDGDLPEPGARVALPELGELVVLRRGISPLPLDDRPCVFLEPPVPAA